MSQQWHIFKGTKTPQKEELKLPSSPPWRNFGRKESEKTLSAEEVKGSTFEIEQKEIELVNAALYLRRPLLVTGKPGTGKSSLAYAIAYELNLGKVLKWSINTRTTLNDGLYRYDAIGRLQDAQLRKNKQNNDNQSEGEIEENIGRYIQLGALGTAFLPNDKPRVLLIDEIDKSDIDLPNDLLNLFEEGEFEIPELARIDTPSIKVRTYDNQTVTIKRGQITCQEFPLVIMTSNGERDFPPAFLRRCLQLEMSPPDKDKLTKIVQSHFKSEPETLKKAEEFIQEFINRRNSGDNIATDQLLNLVFMLKGKQDFSDKDKQKLLEHLLQPLDRVKGEY